MNHALVMDASVVVKVVIEEEFSDRAIALLDDCQMARRPIVAPPHLSSEVTNAIYQQMRRRSITESEADQALDQFLQIPLQVVDMPDLYRNGLAITKFLGIRNAYDGVYLALAEAVSAELWTDDRTLMRVAGPSRPWLRWIGDFSIP